MIPDKGTYAAHLVSTYYIDGRIVAKYRVLVPDSTISGDFRHEYIEIEFHGSYIER